jgi:hypothetical protein
VSQSTVIFGTLIAAFLVYITVKGELPDYLGVVGLGAKA